MALVCFTSAISNTRARVGHFSRTEPTMTALTNAYCYFRNYRLGQTFITMSLCAQYTSHPSGITFFSYVSGGALAIITLVFKHVQRKKEEMLKVMVHADGFSSPFFINPQCSFQCSCQGKGRGKAIGQCN